MENVSATPQIPEIKDSGSAKARPAIRVATPDLLVSQNLVLEVLSPLFYEELSSHELINISRNDIVNGQEVSYSLIKNLKGIQKKYNTLNIFSLPNTIEALFKNFSIRFDIHVPNIGTGPNEERAYVLAADTAIATRGDIIIDVINMETNERVDVEIIRSGQALSDTIYLEES